MIRKEKNLEFMPNQKLHRNISFLKSCIRIIGYIFLIVDLKAAMGLLLFSESLGIVEELV
jgi:hypothetical protein